MTIELFTEQVRKLVQEKLGKGYQVVKRQVLKNNGVHQWGIEIRQKTERVVPVAYMESYYAEFQRSEERKEYLEPLAVKLIEQVQTPNLETEMIQNAKTCLLDRNWTKEHLVYRLLNRKHNAELLKDIPYRGFHNLAIIYCVLAGESQNGICSYVMHREQMERLGFDEETLFKAAQENTRKFFPAQFAPLFEVIKQTAMEMGEDLSEVFGKEMLDEEVGKPMYVLSNTSKCYGAAVLLYPGILENIAQSLQSDLVILPSSCHEVLILPYDEGDSIAGLTEMVCAVNRECVAPMDVLSDSVYLYRRADEALVMVVEAELERTK